MMDLAPIVLFVYNRPAHTQNTLVSLSRNVLADKSRLYVYCDGPKKNASEATKQKIEEVLKVVHEQQWCKEVKIVRSKTNKGLATNVFEGVTEIVERYGKVIVLEDDLVIGRGFLEYINQGLDLYKDIDRVKQISGFVFPFNADESNSAFFMPPINSIGWGTWSRAWSEIEQQPQGYERLKRDRDYRRKFNLDDSYNYSKIFINQVEKGTNDSWGILYWWASFKRNGLTLYPDHPLLQHNDFDSSGTHVSDFSHYDHPDFKSNYRIMHFPEDVILDERRFVLLKQYFKAHTGLSLRRIWFKLKNWKQLVISN